MIHLACVVDEVDAARQACGQRPEGVVIELSDHLACAGRWCDGPDPSADAPALMDHDGLVQQLMGSCGSVVPFRYGTVVDDPDALRAELRPRARQFLDLLAWLRGRVELALRASPAPTPPTSAPDGRRPDRAGASYLRALSRRTFPEPLEALHRRLLASSVAAVAEADGRGGIKASYLVERADVDGFCRLLDRATADTEGLESVSLTGPWAPYTFAATIDDRPAVAQAGAVRGGNRA